MSRTLHDIVPLMDEQQTAWGIRVNGKVVAKFYEPDAQKNARLFLRAWLKRSGVKPE